MQQTYLDDIPNPTAQQRKLREALQPYLDLELLKRLAVTPGADLFQALRHAPSAVVPEEVTALLGAMMAVYAPERRAQINNPAELAPLLMASIGGLDQENLVVVSLDTKNRLISIATVYVGSVDRVSVRIGEVFKPAIRANATAVLFAHNHPSNDTTPSQEDSDLTKLLVTAGRNFDITVHDHIVVGLRGFVSIRERNPSIFARVPAPILKRQTKKSQTRTESDTPPC